MSKKCKIIIISIVFAFIILSGLLIIQSIRYFGIFHPTLTLKGDSIVYVNVKEEYIEEGYIVHHNFKDLSQEVEMLSNVNTDKVGEYTITYNYQGIINKERTIIVVDTINPQLTLKGDATIYTFVNNEYIDEGAIALDNYDLDITNRIMMDNQVDITKVGTYEILYSVTDSSNNEATISRTIVVAKDPMDITLKYTYSNYDNVPLEFWFNKSDNHERNTCAYTAEDLAKYNAYYIGEDEKVIYLTLDEGGSEGTFIYEISEILNKYNVDATYFLTRNYIENNAEFIRDLVANNHVIANHTWNHLDMSSLANAQSIDKFVDEITSVEKVYMEVTGQEMKKIFRFPKGESSERSLKILQDLGYTTYFWSHAYYDYGEAISYETAYTSLIEYYHNGAIYLMHPSNEGNYLAIEDFIVEMLELGYTFKTLEEV